MLNDIWTNVIINSLYPTYKLDALCNRASIASDNLKLARIVDHLFVNAYKMSIYASVISIVWIKLKPFNDNNFTIFGTFTWSLLIKVNVRDKRYVYIKKVY